MRASPSYNHIPKTLIIYIILIRFKNTFFDSPSFKGCFKPELFSNDMNLSKLWKYFEYWKFLFLQNLPSKSKFEWFARMFGRRKPFPELASFVLRPAGRHSFDLFQLAIWWHGFFVYSRNNGYSGSGHIFGKVKYLF